MPPQTSEASLIWEGDVPVSRRYADSYYARSDGLAESRHVFLAGTGLPEAWMGRQHFTVAELGFGTGLNFLATLAEWRRTGRGTLDYVAFEWAPLSPVQMARALGRWPELAGPLAALLEVWPGPTGGSVRVRDVRVELTVGDARVEVPRWQGLADAWFLDGFAPSRNPEMWEPALLAEVYHRTVPGGRAATYSAAGAVRRALAAAGFRVERQPGFGGKRHMTVAERPRLAAAAPSA